MTINNIQTQNVNTARYTTFKGATVYRSPLFPVGSDFISFKAHTDETAVPPKHKTSYLNNILIFLAGAGTALAGVWVFKKLIPSVQTTQALTTTATNIATQTTSNTSKYSWESATQVLTTTATAIATTRTLIEATQYLSSCVKGLNSESAKKFKDVLVTPISSALSQIKDPSKLLESLKAIGLSLGSASEIVKTQVLQNGAEIIKDTKEITRQLAQFSQSDIAKGLAGCGEAFINVLKVLGRA